MANYDYVKVPWPGWHVVDSIGEGGYGRVYEIERTQSDITEHAALKIISVPKSKSEYEAVRFSMDTAEDTSRYFEEKKDKILREIKALQELKGCANILDIDDWTIIEKENGPGWDIYIRMELLRNLQSAFRDGVPSEEDVIELGKDICTALERCEKKGIIHRDIKPSNILVNGSGDYKLTDFGIARTLDHTTYVTGVGTPPYMSPEVYNGQEADKTVDLYSLGLVMYGLLNDRRLPFVPRQYSPVDEAAATARRTSGEEIPEPMHGSPALKKAVLKACAFDPKDRYGSAAEMKKAIVKAEKAPYDVSDDSEKHTSGKKKETVKTAPAFTPSDEGWEDASKTIGAYDPALHKKAPKKGPQKQKDPSEPATQVSAGTGPDKNKGQNKNKGLNKKQSNNSGSKGGSSKKIRDRKKTIRNVIIGILGVAAVSFGIIYFTVHFYTEATCTEPAKCKLCGKISEEALGHDWEPPTCTEDGYCRRCGEEGEAALGHDWVEATYDSPKTCSRCGLTEGEIKGYISGFSGSFEEKTTTLDGWDTHAFVLDDPIDNCRWLKLGTTFTDMSSDLYGEYRIYYRSNGKWSKYWAVDISELDHEYTGTYNAEGDTVEAIAIVPDHSSAKKSYTYSYNLRCYDAQAGE